MGVSDITSGKTLEACLGFFYLYDFIIMLHFNSLTGLKWLNIFKKSLYLGLSPCFVNCGHMNTYSLYNFSLDSELIIT